MRTYMTKLTAIALAIASVFVTACSSDEDTKITPNFDEQKDVTATLAAGETTTFTIKPNAEWALSLPTTQAGAEFWIDNDGQKAYTLRGVAGEFSVTVCSSDAVQFDKTPTCDVMLTIGKTEQKIGTLTLTPAIREFAVFSCLMDEDGQFTYGTEEGYTYSYNATPVTSIDLVWPNGLNGYSMPIDVKANFDWELTGYPDWVSAPAVSTGEANQHKEIRLGTELSKYPLNGATDELVFWDKNNHDATMRLPIVIPACKDHLVISRISETLDFDLDGYADGLTGTVDVVNGTISSAKGAKFFVLKKEGNWYYPEDEEVAWVTLKEEDPWDDSANADVIQERRFSVKVTEATSTRQAVLIALPNSLAAGVNSRADLLNSDGDAILPQYEPYIFSNLTQGGSEGLSFAYPDWVYHATLEELTSGPDFEPYAEFGKPVYLLTYASEGGSNNALKGPAFANSHVQKGGDWLKTEGASDNFYVFMDSQEKPNEAKDGVIFYNDDGGSIVFILVCKYAPSTL